MPKHKVEIGSVFQPDWDDRPLRVLAFDDVEVLYDCWWPHADRWGLSSLRGIATYYRIPMKFLRAHAVPIRKEPLTSEEWNVHRPDLPLRLCQFSQLQWTTDRYSTMSAYASSIKKASAGLEIDAKHVALAIPIVILIPFGPKGSPKRGIEVKAQSDVGFSALELLWLGQNMQSQYVKEWEQGVGIYRSGFQRGRPSFYLWGKRDKAGFAE